MGLMRLADYVIQYLETKGVDTVFTVSGGGAIHLCDALAQAQKIKYFCCHHEQAVSIAAEGYSRTSGRVGVCLVTTGPGGTNAVTGVACAWTDSVPQIIISGQVYLNQTIGTSGVRQHGVQETNIVDIVEPITKYAVMVRNPEDILCHLEHAWHLATSGRPGPVWVDIPADIQNAMINPELLETPTRPEERSNGDGLEESVTQAAQWLKNAKRPLLHIGQGVRLAQAQNLLLELAERHQIPIATTWNATDVIDSSHPLFVGRPGNFTERASNFMIQNSDVYLAIGSRLPFMVTGYNAKDFARQAKRVMVDIDPSETGKESLDIHLRITADAGEFLHHLIKALPADWRCERDWIDKCQDLRRKYPIVKPEYRSQPKWVNSYYFIELLSEKLGTDSAIMTDMGLAFVGTHQAFRVKAGQKVCTNSGHAPMGWGLPAAIGSCLARDKRKTICISGEGGMMMNLQELSTAMHHNLPIKLFIYNNGGYLTIKQTQQMGFEGRLMGSTPDSGISFPRFKKISEAHGFSYHCFRNNAQLKDGLDGFLNEEGCGICELMIDPEQPQIPKAVSARKDRNGSEQPVFEDLYPFLDREEFEEVKVMA